MSRIRLETFRCSATEHGKQCVYEFTLANAFSYTIKTLVSRDTERKGVTLRTIAENAICPFHARLLRYVRKDICKMAYVLEDYRKRVKIARGEWYWEHRELLTQEKYRRLNDAETPTMALAMKVAGVGQKWPPR